MTQEIPTEVQTSAEQKKHDWLDRFHKALAAYKNSLWEMADCLREGKRIIGYNKLRDFYSPFDQTKLRWFLALSTLKTRNHSLLPEHHAELFEGKMQEKKSNPERKLTLALQRNWKPSELRKHLRECNRTSAPKNSGSIKKWTRRFEQVRSEINQLPDDQKQKAILFINSSFPSSSHD